MSARILDGLELWLSRWTPPLQADARDYLVPIHGTDWRALGAVDRMRVVLALPVSGPTPQDTCDLELGVTLSIRYPTSADGRTAMLADMKDLADALRVAVWTAPVEPRQHPHDADAATALAKITRVAVGAPAYQYGLFPGQNVTLAILPLRLEYCR